MKNSVFEPKSLFLTCQETLTKNLDALYELGYVPYEFIEQSLRHASPEQLQRIEKCNPKIKRETNGLWLAHCLLFPDIKEEYNRMGLHEEQTRWRSLYRRRYEENELKKETVKQKIREKYNIINNEKAAKSIKVIKGVLPRKGRTYEDSRRANMSPLFHKSRKETSKVASIYNTSQRRPPPPPPPPPPPQSSTSQRTLVSHRPITMSRSTPSSSRPITATTSRPSNSASMHQQRPPPAAGAVATAVVRPSKSALVSSRPMTRPAPRPITNRSTITANQIPTTNLITHHPAQPDTSPAQYLRTLPIPQKQPILRQAPTPPSSQYKVNSDRYLPYHSPPISPPFSPPRSHSPENRPHKKPKMYL